MTVTPSSGFSVGVQLAPVVEAPAQAAVPAPVSPAALPALQMPKTSIRDVAIFGGMNLLSLAGMAGALSFAGAGPALVAATLGAAVTVGATAVRLFGGPRPEKGMLAAIESERLALDSARRMLDVQATGLAVDRERVAGETESLNAMRKELQNQRERDLQGIEQTLSFERAAISHQVAKQVEEELTPLREQLSRDREALQRERSAFEGHKAGLLAPIAAEVDALSRKEVQAIHGAIESYLAGTTHRIVAQPYHEHSPITPASEPLSAGDVLPTLMKQGRVYAGPSTDPGSHVRFYSVSHEQATALTSVADLTRFLRAATGKKV